MQDLLRRGGRVDHGRVEARPPAGGDDGLDERRPVPVGVAEEGVDNGRQVVVLRSDRLIAGLRHHPALGRQRVEEVPLHDHRAALHQGEERVGRLVEALVEGRTVEAEVLVLEGVGELVDDDELLERPQRRPPHEQGALVGVVEAEDAVLLDGLVDRGQVEGAGHQAEDPEERGEGLGVGLGAGLVVGLLDVAQPLGEGVGRQQLDRHRTLEAEAAGLLHEGQQPGQRSSEGRFDRYRRGVEPAGAVVVHRQGDRVADEYDDNGGGHSGPQPPRGQPKNASATP